MKIKPIISNRINPAKLGIEIENKEYDALQENTDGEGHVHLDKVYNIPAPSPESDKQKTLVKYMENEGIDYTETQYKKEYQLKAVHQYMINGASTAQIAQALNVSLNEAKNLKRELAARQLNEIKNFDAHQEIAKAYMFYDHIGAKALQLAAKSGDKIGIRSNIEALKVALQAQSDKQKFLALAGAYESGLRSGDGNNRHVNDASDVRSLLTGVLSGDAYEVVSDDDELDDGIEVL